MTVESYGGNDPPHAFHSTIVRIDAPDGAVVVQPGVSHPQVPWTGLAHVITGWNPGRLATAEENNAANITLEKTLRATGLEVFPATGDAIDGTWSEESFAVVGMLRAQAVALGRRFGQLAIFEITANQVSVLDCR